MVFGVGWCGGRGEAVMEEEEEEEEERCVKGGRGEDGKRGCSC